MKNELLIQKFIREHLPDWEMILADKPYCISVSRDVMFGRSLMLLKYNQIDSDFTLPIVRECRGLILDEKTLEPVCVPFFKFGNAGEKYVPDIDWNTAFVSQKLDGSLIKVVKSGNDLLWSTNGTIDANKANLQEQLDCPYKTFFDLIRAALREEYARHMNVSDGSNIPDDSVDIWFKVQLKPGFTYMFELTSPYNRIVVRWNDVRLNFIGCRNNETFEEIRFFEHDLAKIFKTPKIYPLKSLDDCIAAAKELGTDEEGYVVCDGKFNRAKIKGPVYVAMHHLKGENGVMSYRRALEIVKAGEIDEVIAYFPEYETAFKDLKSKFEKKVSEVENAWNKFSDIRDSLPARKDQAVWITSHVKEFAGFMFGMLDGKITDLRKAIWDCPNDKILRMLGYKED